MGNDAKTVGFSEKYKAAFGPSPHIFGRLYYIFFLKFMLKKPCFNCPKSAIKIFRLKILELFRTFVHFVTATRS